MKAEDYVKIIVEDDLNRITWEDTIVQEPAYIRRLYEIDDGAMVQYEWRAYPGDSAEDDYNHRFTLNMLPKKNTEELELGVIKAIPHPPNFR